MVTAIGRPRSNPVGAMVIVLAACFSLISTCVALADGVLIPVPGRVDMVHDVPRDTLYITSGGSILRYHMPTDSFLQPFVIPILGADLGGVDISDDGNYLV